VHKSGQAEKLGFWFRDRTHTYERWEEEEEEEEEEKEEEEEEDRYQIAARNLRQNAGTKTALHRCSGLALLHPGLYSVRRGMQVGELHSEAERGELVQVPKCRTEWHCADIMEMYLLVGATHANLSSRLNGARQPCVQHTSGPILNESGRASMSDRLPSWAHILNRPRS